MREQAHNGLQIDCRDRGFTLNELMITLSIAAITATLAVASYQGIVQHNVMAAGVNDLVGDLNYARSQAVTRGQPVYLCKSTDGQTCETEGNVWSQGWIVYAPESGSNAPTDANLLRVHGPLQDPITITGNRNIETKVFFDAGGLAMASIGTFIASAADITHESNIVIASTGRIRTDEVPPDS